MTSDMETRPAYEGGNGRTIEHDPNETARPRKAGHSLSFTVGLALATVIGIGAVVAQGAGWGPGGWRPGGMGHMGVRFAEHRVGAVLDEIDASKEQEDKIWAIIDRTRSDLRPMGRDFRETREKIAMILSAPVIDRAALETLRAERVAALDEASKKAVSAIGDAAEVLTPEQRTKLAAEIKEHHRRW